MTKSELIDKVSQAVNDDRLTKKLIEEVIVATFDEIKSSLSGGDRVSFPGFGSFNVKERAARKGRNPQTGAPIDIPASKTVSFKPASKLKESL